MRNREQQKKPNWLTLAIILLILIPDVVIPVAICGGIGYLFFTLAKNGKFPTAGKKTAKAKPAFDDCPKSLFCFHKDKGEHHVVRGKEIDPWDRPDIDISKYQRKG